MATPINTSAGTLIWGKQPDRDTRAIAGNSQLHRLQWSGGNLATDQVVNDTEVLDGQVFSSPFSHVDRVTGGGEITCLGDAGTIGRALNAILGVDTIGTPVAGTNTHEIDTSSAGNGSYFTFYKSIGNGTAANRAIFEACKISRVVIRATAAAQVCEVVLSVVCLKPQIFVDSGGFPAAEFEPEDPFTFADGQGAYIVSDLNGGSAIGSISQFELTVARDQDPWQGDDIFAHELIAKRGQVTVGATLLGDDENLKLLFNTWYDDPTPSVGDRPTNNVFEDTFSLQLENGTPAAADHRLFSAELPKLRYRVGDFEPNTGGDAAELAIDGRARKPAGAEMLTATVRSADVIAY